MDLVKLGRLREWRDKRLMTQHELAERVGLSEGALNRIEKGRAEPRPSTVRKLAQALDIDPSELRMSRSIRIAHQPESLGGNVRLLSTSDDLDWSPTIGSRLQFRKGSFGQRTITNSEAQVISTGSYIHELVLRSQWEALLGELTAQGWQPIEPPLIENDPAVVQRLGEIGQEYGDAWRVETWRFYTDD